MRENNKYRLRHKLTKIKNIMSIMLSSLIEILAYFPKFQKAMWHTSKSLVAHRWRTSRGTQNLSWHTVQHSTQLENHCYKYFKKEYKILLTNSHKNNHRHSGRISSVILAESVAAPKKAETTLRH